MSLRVAFICVVPSPYQRDLLAALAARPEVDLHVYYMERAAPDSPWPEKPLAPYEEYLPGFWFALGSRRIHVNWPLPDLSGYDVVVLNTLMSFTAQWLMRVRLRGRRWLFWGERLTRGVPDPSPFAAIHRWLLGPLQQAAGIVGIGKWAVDDYRARFGGSRYFNIPYHCELAPFLAQARHVREDDAVTFLFCGQMIARKGLDLLLAVFLKLPARARLLLVGREAELPRMLAALPDEARTRIEYAGFQAPDDLPRFFARADVFVLPSRYDGWGVVVNQALGAGLPIICTYQVGAGHDLVTAGFNGYKTLCNERSLEAAIRLFLDHPEAIDSFGSTSRQRAHEWLPSEGAAKWVAALHSIAS
ncbi:MAG TPA: glycosyltransferase family 4 protein [Chthoniobacteraceae bacterium]|jgi:glycosyltransferase involved in cell wall biosynthesis|nr:glycosyltransferase family 4 protein [Chthoniobacteraceae bacterium]